ncbi:dihydrofolate reductase [Daedaleopsis nitida]|nr:dihydrofolate reductase [Daedaleopsis nitida]
MTRLTLIVAATRAYGIGRNAQLPWRLPKEMAYFKRVTTMAPEGSMNVVVMGRNTWESIPPRFRPLDKRMNVVISSNKEYRVMPEDADTRCAPVYLRPSLDVANQLLDSPDVQAYDTSIHRTFIIGGASLYRDTLAIPPDSSSFVDRVLLTRILSPEFEDCDVFMPRFLDAEVDKEGYNDTRPWRLASHDELQEWVGFEVPARVQEENGIQYEFQMWVR